MAHHTKFNGITPDKINIQAIEAKCQAWLKQNRKGYNAERWAFIMENYSKPGEFTIPLPPEADQILTLEERAGTFEGPLPPEWFPPMDGGLMESNSTETKTASSFERLAVTFGFTEKEESLGTKEDVVDLGEKRKIPRGVLVLLIVLTMFSLFFIIACFYQGFSVKALVWSLAGLIFYLLSFRLIWSRRQ
jgi:hypothetical protein